MHVSKVYFLFVKSSRRARWYGSHLYAILAIRGLSLEDDGLQVEKLPQKPKWLYNPRKTKKQNFIDYCITRKPWNVNIARDSVLKKGEKWKEYPPDRDAICCLVSLNRKCYASCLPFSPLVSTPPDAQRVRSLCWSSHSANKKTEQKNPLKS